MRRRILYSLLLLISAGLTGCEEDLVSRDHVAAPFSIYGVLSPDLTTQSIRVYPLEDIPTLGSPEPLDVNVVSTDLETGERLTWRDTVLVEPNGQHEYIYWAPFRAEFGHEYRVEVVRRADGARSFAEVRVPEPVIVRIVNDRDAAAMQVLIEGERIRVLKPELVYTLANIASGCQVIRNRFSYQGRERRVEAGWRVDVNLVVDRSDILFECNGLTVFPPPYCPPFLHLRSLDLNVLVGDVAWDPAGGVLDPDLLSEHNTMTNVENGFGFIGAGYRTVAPLYPSNEALEYACFAYASD
jgi:hypothetical protein